MYKSVQTGYPQPYPHYDNYTTSPNMAYQRSQQSPPSPSEQSERNGATEEDYYNLSGPAPTSHVWGDRIWALEVVQHPQRARMCGFGDKDRRPISPPPAVRLIILDAKTRKEVKYEEVELAHLVLTVDIWDLSGSRELNLVKQGTASPCISSAVTGAFPTLSTAPPRGHEQPPHFPIAQIPYQNYSNSAQASAQTPQPGSTPASYHSQYQYDEQQQQQQRYQAPPASPYGQQPLYAPGYSGAVPENYLAHGHAPAPVAQSQFYTRNLIGSLSASAFRLNDQHGKMGIWFVLQDLSVRTEGWFRLKFNFFNLAQSVETQIRASASIGESQPTVQSTAPCLASAFSNPFKVFSAKKFPGVVESTDLSKAFAAQGVKIPVRRDAQGGKRGRDGSDDEDNVSDVDG